jgi:hypothetical protein
MTAPTTNGSGTKFYKVSAQPWVLEAMDAGNQEERLDSNGTYAATISSKVKLWYHLISY